MDHSTVYRLAVAVLLTASVAHRIAAAEPHTTEAALTIQDRLIHLRGSGDREWSSFPKQPQAASLSRKFQAKENAGESTLSLRQIDVKQRWDVRINDILLGRLVQHENDLITDFAVPPNTLRGGENVLEIKQTGRDTPDDIRVGQVELVSQPKTQRRHAAMVQVVLINEAEHPTAGRITITDREGTLVPVGAVSGNGLAVREGVIYTATGTAEFGLAEGRYRIDGGRGFEYNAPSTRIDVETGLRIKRTLQLMREVDTTGWVACDTHVHTVTHSGHGDATIEERMVTLAGEGVELPIATDHNKPIDYEPIAQTTGVRKYFTPVIGNEVTTDQGHFNIFAVRPGARLPDHTLTDWDRLSAELYETPHVQAVILNHARDIHAGFRPFSPRHHLSLSGENLDGRTLPANAMEIINSGAVQTDPMQLFGDWCGLVNRGAVMTPVGSSDSHDVARYIVGQGRTYIRADDTDPGKIDVDAATQAFIESRVLVSYGLLAMIKVNDQYEPGDLVSLGEQDAVTVTARILGPSWAACDSVTLYMNGHPIRQSVLESRPRGKSPLDEERNWEIPQGEIKHDAWLCLVARGPGIDTPFWKTAKPYQPDSPDFKPYTFASTGPVWIDVDGNGYSSPRAIAEQIVAAGEGDVSRIITSLSEYDASVAIQAASVQRERGIAVDPGQLEDAPQNVQDAFHRYQRDWRQSERARVEAVE